MKNITNENNSKWRRDKSLDHIPGVLILSQGIVSTAWNTNVAPSLCVLVFQIWCALKNTGQTCVLWHLTNLKLLIAITKFRLLLVRLLLPESHHQWEAGRWPGGMTDIIDVLFIYNFNKKQKKRLPCVLIEHKVISHHTAFLLLLPEPCSDISSTTCALQRGFFSNALGARELPPWACSPPVPLHRPTHWDFREQ